VKVHALVDSPTPTLSTENSVVDVTRHLTREELEAGMHEICRAPREEGTLEMIVRRPSSGEREVLGEGELDLEVGLVGDNWKARGSRSTPDGSAHPEMQLNIMSARVVALLAQTRERWALAGDQLFIDLDLSTDNLPPGTRLAIGSAMIEITSVPHTGCAKFAARFGAEATRFVNSPVGKLLRLRGLNAKIVQPGNVRAGDRVKRIAAAS
jgi:hypothetical protein